MKWRCWFSFLVCRIAIIEKFLREYVDEISLYTSGPLHDIDVLVFPWIPEDIYFTLKCEKGDW